MRSVEGGASTWGYALARAKTGGQKLIYDAPRSLLQEMAPRHTAENEIVGLGIGTYSCGGVPSSVAAFLESQRTVTRMGFLARVFGRQPVPKSLRQKYRAACDDLSVISVLSQLGSDWMVRSSEPAGANGAEHIVIGPPGIFCLVVRHEPGGAMWIDGGVVQVDGERRTHLRDAEFSAVRLTQLMSDASGSRVEVTPCLVLLGTRSVTVAKPPKRVAILTSRDVRTWLKGLPTVLSKSELKGLQAEAAAHPELHALIDQRSASDSALEEFRKTRAEMAQARHLRLSWITGALVALWLVTVVGAGGAATSFLVG